jgi:glycosyltransferase involved in cell wall biosynthesis
VKFLVSSGTEVKLIHCYNEGTERKSHKDISKELFGDENKSGFESEMLLFPKAGKVPGHYIRRSYNYSKAVFENVQSEIDSFDFVYIKGFSGWKLLEEKKQFKTLMAINFHGYEMFQKFPDLKTRIKNQILIKPVRKNIQKADYVFSYGGGIDDLLIDEGVDKNKILSIHGAVDDIWFESNESKEVKPSKKLLFVGRFERRKGVEELNEVLPELLDKYDFTFDFVGPIPEENKIDHPNVSYLGELISVDQIKEVYQNHDILIAPSYSEGMPNVIMEAMSQGLAVLATDVGATSILVNQENGWLMPEMSKKILGDFLINILSSDSKDIAAKKISSQEKLDSKFSWKQIASNHIEKIQKIIVS